MRNRLIAARHKMFCGECRVTWTSWFGRIFQCPVGLCPQTEITPATHQRRTNGERNRLQHGDRAATSNLSDWQSAGANTESRKQHDNAGGEPSDIKEPKTIRDCQLCHRGRIVCNACWEPGVLEEALDKDLFAEIAERRKDQEFAARLDRIRNTSWIGWPKMTEKDHQPIVLGVCRCREKVTLYNVPHDSHDALLDALARAAWAAHRETCQPT